MADQSLLDNRAGSSITHEASGLGRLARPAYMGAAWLFLVLIPLQFFFAGTGVFSTTGFSLHIYLGLALHVLSGVLIVVAVVGRLPQRSLVYGVLQFVLIGLQVVLVRISSPSATISIEPQVVSNLITAILQPIHDMLGSNAGLVAALHAVNGLAISAVAVLTAIYARKLTP